LGRVGASSDSQIAAYYFKADSMNLSGCSGVEYFGILARLLTASMRKSGWSYV